MSRRLKILLVFSIIAVLLASFWYLWRIKTGKIQLSAQTELCQNQSRIEAMYGGSQWSIGSQLVPVNFMGQEVLFHKEAAPWLKKVAKEIKERKSTYSFSNVQTFNWRVKTTGYGQSLHSYGIAIDINPGSNPYNFSGRLITDLPKNVIEVFKKYGFYWGGDWKGFVDPMHFEWYGSKITGKIIDKYNRNPVEDVSVYVDRELLTKISGNFSFSVPEGKHIISIKNPKYKEYKFIIRAGCNQVFSKNISLQPIPLGVPGKITGKVILPPQSPLSLPADIYVDGVYSVKTDVNGFYVVDDVAGGLTHVVEAKIMPIFVGSTRVKVIPGKTIKDVNIQVGPGINR